MFKETLLKAKKNNIHAWRLLVATEVDEYFKNNEIEISESEFEEICYFIYDWVMSTEATPYEIIENLVKVVQRSDYYKFNDLQYYYEDITKEINEMF